MLSSTPFVLLVKTDTLSFNYFIILFFSSCSFSDLSNLLVINSTVFERSASDCLLSICFCLFWLTKLQIVATSFSKFFKQFIRIPLQPSLCKTSFHRSHSLLVLEAEVVSLSFFLTLWMF